jgi:hypothetical protein
VTSGKGDFFFQTVAVELIADELSAIVGVDIHNGKGNRS